MVPLTSLLEPLSEVVHGAFGLWVFGPDGERVEHIGFDDGFAAFDAVTASIADGRACNTHEMFDGSRIVLTFPESEATPWADVLDALVRVELERHQLENDLESMSASSLALLEEAAMVGDLMTELSTGETEEGVVERGLEKLLVGVSAERSSYFRYDRGTGGFEFVTQIVWDADSRRGIVAPYEGQQAVPRDGVFERATQGAHSVVLESVDGSRADPTSPEGLAKRELLAVPVMHGEDQQAKLLGVLLLYDKRATTYSSVVTFGSHEIKMASGLASMLAAVLGARKTAELGKELKMATMIQQQILPDRPAEVGGFDLAGRCTTSGAVGGDYFDYLPMVDGRTMCVVADVSGHNLASGMVMVSARATLRSLTARQQDAANVFRDLASLLFNDLSRTERFITAAGVVLTPNSGAIEILNAGHNDTMIYRAATGTVERVPSEDTILGFLEHATYDGCPLELNSGDVLILYTDGVTEAMNAEGEMFEEDRLAAVLADAANGSAQEILDAIYGAVDDFAEEAGGDDITAVVVRCVGEGSGR